jgi:LAO/AO transport system kinase
MAQRAATLIEASGKDYVFIETVGVGQTELDVMEVADTVVVVLVPEAGDTIQTMKAGLMEIGDVFVVNKADREGAERLAQDMMIGLSLGAADPAKERPPVLLTQAHRGVGVPELAEAIRHHRAAMEKSGELQRRRQRRAAAQLFKTVEEKLNAALHDLIERNPQAKALVEQVRAGTVDPYSAALTLLRQHALLKGQ